MTIMVIGYVKPTHTQKETRGHSSRVHGNGWVEWVKLGNCIEEWLRPLDRRVDSYHTQVNTHMHRVTHVQKIQIMQMHTHRHTHKHTHRHIHKDNTHL